MSEFKEKMEAFQTALQGERPQTDAQRALSEFQEGLSQASFQVDRENDSSPVKHATSEDVVDAAPDSDQEEEEAPKKERKKNENPFRKRIDQMTYEKKLLQEHNQYLADQLARAQTDLGSLHQKATTAEKLNDNAMMQTIELTERSLKRQLRSAKEELNLDEEERIQDEMENLREQKRFLKSKESENYADDPVYSIPYSAPAPIPQESPNPVYNEWVTRNEWANQYSQNFSPELRQDADRYAIDLNAKLKFNNAASWIGTEEYFKVIDTYMHSKYGVQSDHEEAPMNTNSGRPPVASVNRSGGSLADQYMSNNPQSNPALSLTPMELQLVRNTVYRDDRGRILNEQESIAKYAESKRKRMSRR